MTDWIRDSSILSSHFADESGLVGAAGAIVFPRSPEEAGDAVAAAAAERRSVTIQGGKTGFCAGAVPDGGVVVNLSRMNAVTAFKYDRAKRKGFVTVQAGCTLEQINEGLRKKTFDPAGWDLDSQSSWEDYARSPDTLWFLPNPTEKTATIGGMAATGATGSRVAGGAMAEHITGMTVVLADGRVAHMRKGDGAALVLSGKATVSPPRPGALNCVCGSEGIVGMIAGLTLSLTPRPAAMCGLMTFHDGYTQASAFLRSLEQAASGKPETAIMSAGWFDVSCRDFLAGQAAVLPQTAQAPDFPPGAAVSLWMEFAGADEDALFSLLSAAMELLENGGGFADAALAATDDRDMDRLGCFRHLVTETCNRVSTASPSPILDWVAPQGDWAAVADRMADAFRKAGIPFALMGHARDGRTSARLPGMPSSSDEAERVVGMAAECLEQADCRASGGHGYGRLKCDWFRELNPEEWERWRLFRAAADPLGLLNPCVMAPA